jgi:hypothetical protein
MEKLATPDFQSRFQAHRYDLIVLLDVDKEYEQFLRDSGILDARSEGQRGQYDVPRYGACGRLRNVESAGSVPRAARWPTTGRPG